MKILDPLLIKAAHIASTGVNSFLNEVLDFGLAYNEGIMLEEITFIAVGMAPDGRADGLLHADPEKTWTTQTDLINDQEVIAWASFGTETTGGYQYSHTVGLLRQVFARNLTLLVNHTTAASSIFIILKYRRVFLEEAELVGLISHRRG